jgi:hypothetical protein
MCSFYYSLFPHTTSCALGMRYQLDKNFLFKVNICLLDDLVGLGWG